MTTQRKQTQVPVTDITEALEKGVDAADMVRAAGLRGLQRIRAAKIMGLQREHVRLSQKLGPDHPRVVALGEKLKVNRILVQQLALEARRAATELPPRDEAAWTLYGYVHDQDLLAAPNLTVALYNEEGSWIVALGHIVTNRSGYFKLEVREFEQYAGQPLYVRVLDHVATHLYVDSNPVTPELGTEEYREITLQKDAAVDISKLCNGTQPIADKDHWVIRGRVTDENAEGVDGVTVKVFDKDYAFSDRLGQTRTDAVGYYQLTYRVEDFRDVVEQNPELCLEVLGDEEQVLYRSEAPFHFKGSCAEVLNVEIELR